MKKYYLHIILLIFTVLSYGQNIVTIDRVNGPGPTSVGTATNVLAEGLTRGGGVVQEGANGAAQFISRGFNTNSEAQAVANDDYIQIAAFPVSNYTLKVTRLRVQLIRGTSGPVNFRVYYSFDGFATPGTVLSPVQVVGTTAADYELNGLNLNPPVGEGVTFRLYAWNAANNNANATLSVSGNPNWTNYGILLPGVTVGGTSSFDGLVYSGGAWLPSAPNATTGNVNAIVRNGTTAFTTDVQLNNLIVEDIASLNIFPTGSLITNGDLTVDGTLTMQSTSTRYASVIPKGGFNPASVLSTIYQRHVNTNSLSADNDLISAPLTGTNFGTFAASNLNIVFNTNDIFEKLFGPFDKSTGRYITLNQNDDSGYVLEAGVGFRAASTNDGTFDFIGTLNTGEVSVPLTFGGPSFQSWNLVGNPYPSYIRLDAFLAENNTKFNPACAGVYGYDGNASDGWTIWNLAYSEANSEAKITPGQGFLFSVIDEGADCVFLPTMRDTGTSDDFILDRQESSTKFLQLKMDNGSKISKTDFYFSPNASKKMDIGYDAAVFNFTAPSYALYSHLVEGHEGNDLAIQAINPDDMSKVSIPLGVNASQGSTITISLSESTLASSKKVYLEDRLENSYTLLTEKDYTFSANTALSGTGRFFLSFNQSTLSQDSEQLEKLLVYFSKDSREIIIKGLSETEVTAHLFDIQGRSIDKVNLDKTRMSNSLDASHLSNGVYLLKLISNEKSKSKKLIIRN